MRSLSANAGAKTLSFTTGSGSYFYTTFDCLEASTQNYDAITFPIKGPAGSTFALELQTSPGGCLSSALQSHFKTITATGQTQTVTVKLSEFTGANARAVKAIAWGGFSTGSAWTLGEIKLHCEGTTSVRTLPPFPR